MHNLFFLRLMMEQTNAGERHCDTIFVAGLDHMVVANGAAGLCDIVDTAFMRPFDVVAEGEEGVGT